MAKLSPRRRIIREWMSLTPEKRQSNQQASAFADAAQKRHDYASQHDVIMAWPRPRIGRS